MKEFMLLIRNEIDHQASWSQERHQQFLKSCETYIGKLMQDGKLKIAQPLLREGIIISRSNANGKKFHSMKPKRFRLVITIFSLGI